MNMTKEYRAELRDLKRNRKGAERQFEQFIKVNRRELHRAMLSSSKELQRIDKRIAVLEGRLS